MNKEKERDNPKEKPIREFDRPVLYSDEYYYCLLNQQRKILLYSEINEDSAYVVNFKIEGMNIDNDQKPIIIEICSGGGDVSSGYSIINAIQHSQAPIVTVISGEACSMAALIFLVGDHRIMYNNSYIMFHPLSEGQIDYLNFIKDRTKFLITLEKNMVSLCQKYTKFGEEEYMRMNAGELWLTAEQAKRKGVCDKVIK
jgi:ATP-dependent Clp protease protease subunit